MDIVGASVTMSEQYQSNIFNWKLRRSLRAHFDWDSYTIFLYALYGSLDFSLFISKYIVLQGERVPVFVGF